MQLKYEAFALLLLHSHTKIHAIPLWLCVESSNREANGVIIFHYEYGYVLLSFKLITLSIISLQCVAMVVVVAIPFSVYWVCQSANIFDSWITFTALIRTTGEQTNIHLWCIFNVKRVSREFTFSSDFMTFRNINNENTNKMKIIKILRFFRIELNI